MDAVQATFRNGQLELSKPVDWPDGTRADVIPIVPVSGSSEIGAHPTAWPEGYFEQTSGALAQEKLERPDQGQLPSRDEW